MKFLILITLFAVMQGNNFVYAKPVSDGVIEPVVATAKLVGGALAGTVVADAFHAVGGDRVVNSATNFASGATNSAKNWAGGAVDTVKNWFGR